MHDLTTIQLMNEGAIRLIFDGKPEKQAIGPITIRRMGTYFENVARFNNHGVASSLDEELNKAVYRDVETSSRK